MKVDRRQTWSLPGLEGSRFCPASTNCAIGQPLSDNTRQCPVKACRIVEPSLDPGALTEVEFGQIAVEMRLGHVLVNAVNPALEDREVALGSIGVGVIPHIFLGGVVDGLVAAFERPADRGVDTGVIGHEPAIGMGVTGDNRIEVVRGHVGDVETADPAATLYQGYDRLLGGIGP
jgi:hypothetical protein